MNIGFVGLGAMGQVIVPRLLAAGHRVTGWNRSRDRAAPLVKLGMSSAGSPAEVAAASEVTFSIVTDGAAVKAVALGENGVLAGMRPGSIYVDMGTIAPDVTREVAAAFAARGFAMLDAPLSGSPVTVEQGNASLMIGGDKNAFERVEPVLCAIGPKVTYIGAKFGVGSCSGTSALHLALMGVGVKRGDEVITACNTFIATTEAIAHAGAKPVLVDVDENTQLISPEHVEAAVSSKTRAIIPVHLYGQPADMDAMRAIAARKGLKVVADAAQSHGSAIAGDRQKTLGDTTAFSFYPGKNLGAYGDAGLVATDDEEVATTMRALGDHGSKEKYHHLYEGWNYRLDAMQAAVLDVKLKHLDKWTERRRAHAARYDQAFAGTAVRPIAAAPGRTHVYHLYVVRVADRDALMSRLKEKGIGTGIHYPLPLHLQPAYAHLGLKKGAFPIAEKVVASIVSLPMYAEMTDAMVDEVAAAAIDAAK